MTNKEFSETNEVFLNACSKVQMMNGFQGFSPTMRQASKWRNGKGVAFKVANGMPINLKMAGGRLK